MMYINNSKSRIFRRRSFLILSSKLGLSSILVGRLAYLQLFKFNQFDELSKNNYIKSLLIIPERGIIYDRKDDVIATSDNMYRLVIYKNDTIEKEYKSIVDRVAELTSMDEAHKARLLHHVESQIGKPVISVIDNLSWQNLAKIEYYSFDLPSMTTEEFRTRKYPYGESAFHAVGYVAPPTEKESVGQNKKLFNHPDFKIGKSGIEKYFNDDLLGTVGMDYLEVNALGVPIKKMDGYDAIRGKDYKLSLDIKLQDEIYQNIKDRTASVVIMNAHTGEVIAMVSSPSLDPNVFVTGIDDTYWRNIVNHPSKPLNNKTISEIYPPGSVFKLVVSLAALSSGVDPEQRVRCVGHITSGNRQFHCWKKGGHGPVNLHEAIKGSCNVYFYEMSKKIGIEPIIEMAGKLGFGEIPEFEINGCKTGHLPSPEWKKKKLKEEWTISDTLNIAIGQGFISVTPMQLAIMAAAIVNGGNIIKPTFLCSDNGEDGEKVKPTIVRTTGIKQEYLDRVMNGMYAVINEPGGTAGASKLPDEKYIMIGKTGTAQIISRNKNQKLEDIEKMRVGKYQNHGLFVGATSFPNPKYVIAVVVENGISGAASAAPIAKHALLRLQQIDDEITTKNLQENEDRVIEDVLDRLIDND